MLAVFVVGNNGPIVVQLPGVYNYIRVVQLSLTSRQWIQVSGKFSNDFHIALTQNPDCYTANTMYEIVIGGWSDTQSVIRYITVTKLVYKSLNIESVILPATSHSA